MTHSLENEQHPLTDEMCDALKETWGGIGFSHSDMRAAADWQLDECVKELECLLSIFGTTGVIKEEAIPPLVALFKSNMRLQEEA